MDTWLEGVANVTATIKTAELQTLVARIEHEIDESPESERGYMTVHIPPLTKDLRVTPLLLQTAKIVLGAYGWHIENLTPGDSSTWVVTLEKAGAFYIGNDTQEDIIRCVLERPELFDRYKLETRPQPQTVNPPKRQEKPRRKIRGSSRRPTGRSRQAKLGGSRGPYNVKPREAKCPSCGGEVTYPQKRCGHCHSGITWEHKRVR